MAIKHAELMLRELGEKGLSISRLSREAGYSGAALRVVKSRGHGARHLDRLAKLLQVKASILEDYDPKTDSLSAVCKEAGLKQATLAKKLGISKQALQQLQYQLPYDREMALRKELRDLAKEIKKISNFFIDK